MTKYIFKESELNSVLSNIIAEEISRKVNEGLGNVLWNTAKNTIGAGLKATLAAPFAAKDVFEKLGKIYDPNSNDTFTRTVANFMGLEKGDSSLSNSNDKSSSDGKTDTDTDNTETVNPEDLKEIEEEYGVPKMLGKNLASKYWFKVNDFLGFGSDVQFTGHYMENDQDSIYSKWNEKLKKEKERIETEKANGKTVEFEKEKKNIEDWLNSRDKAYEAYAKLKK